MPLSLQRLRGACLIVAAVACLSVPLSAQNPDHLMSRPLPDQAIQKHHSIGARVSTKAGQRQRVLLPDRSVVYLQERSVLHIKANDQVVLDAGEAFIETVPGKLAATLVVKTPKREIRARDSRFGVRIGADGTSVVVAAGVARVAGMDEPIRAGQMLAATADKPAAAPRISHLVAWTADLRNAAPLVPASEHSGGTLIARQPDGQEAKLQLRRYHIDVHIEDGFARTTIDQTYFNHTQDRLEGTFRFPLPADASLSRLAMYVDGKLMEGGMAERDHARAVYERIVWEQRDPALLEWVDGTTFKMRVFPLEPRQEKRLLLSYTQRLPALYGTQSYRFPAGHSLGRVGVWSLNVRVKNGATLNWHSDSHALTARREGGDFVLHTSLKDATLDKDVLLSLTEVAGKEDTESVRFSRMEQDGQQYLLVRYRPALTGEAGVQRRDWVVLVETSADRDPLLARTQIEVLRGLLGCAGRDDTFTLLTASTRTRKLQARPVHNQPEALAEALADLEKTHLVGACDLDGALQQARPLLEAAKNPYLLHIGSGIAAMGEQRTKALLERLPRGARYMGIGVGKRWNRAFMQAAAEATGGYFTQVNPDESVAWRGMDLLLTLNTPRLLDVKVSDSDEKVQFLPFVRLLCQGEELAAVARCQGELPNNVRIAGRLNGKPIVREFPVKDVRDKAGYLPRSWAKLEIERLLAQDSVKHKERIVELSKAMYVMTPFTSLLVLENEDMYARFKVDRGRKDHWARYPAPPKIKVVFEPIEGDAGDPKKGIKPSAKLVRPSVLHRSLPRVLSVRADRRPGLQVLNDAEPAEPAPAAISGEDIRFRGEKHLPINRMLGTTMLGDTATGKDRGLQDNPQPILDGFESSPQADTMGGTDGPALLDAKNKVKKLGQVWGRLPERERVDALTELAKLDKLIEGKPKEDDKKEAPVEFPNSAWTPILTPDSIEVEQPGWLLYTRPGYSNDDRLFYDLLSYAPGLNTRLADVRAVIEKEARINPSLRPGSIGKGVRELFAKARAAGWQTLSIPASKQTAAYRITFDGSGRYAWNRTLPSGLRESVLCDGKTLWHLYPELRLAAQRAVSRFHRLDLARMLPWTLPLPEDLAHGADLECIGDDTVALVPQQHARPEDKGKSAEQPLRLHLIFKDGRLIERRWVKPAEKKTHRREAYSADGSVKVFDKEKEVSSHRWSLEESEAPALKVNLKGLVVVGLPFRTPAQVRTALKLDKKSHGELTFAEARQLLAAFVASGDGAQARQVFEQALSNREQRQLGYYVLLAAAGVNLDSDNLDVLDAHPHEPLAHYLALHSSPVLRRYASRWAAASNTFSEGLLRRLALGHALCQRWASGKSLGNAAQRQAERKRALAYAKQHAGTALAWALLGLVQDRTAEEKNEEIARAAYRDLADAYGLFVEMALGNHARYEQARCLWRAHQKADARKRFLALHEQASKRGALLAIDGDFRAACLSDKDDVWNPLMRRTAAELVKQNKRFAVLALARQCWQLDDAPLSQQLLALALRDAPIKGKEALPLQTAALDFLVETSQVAQAERLTDKLLSDKEHAHNPDLWRIASRVAEQREKPARRLECLEKALELEFGHLPEVVNLKQVREDYGSLLGQYEELTRALATLKLPAPAGFRAKVVRVADRWRALDRDQDKPAQAAAKVLRTLGERELAWDYLTTPLALRPGESSVWISLADTLRRQGERDLADRAYQAAFALESTNAQLLWDRADNLKQTGKLAQARVIYRQIADGDWQPRFASLKTQARWLLDE